MSEVKAKPVNKKKLLEAQYLEIVTKLVVSRISGQDSLEQPHAHKVVDSITTYGAYEKPI